MSQTNTNTGDGNTNQYQEDRRGGQSQGGSWDRYRSNYNDNCRNNSIANYSFEGKLIDSCHFNLTVTTSRYWLTQLKKILDAIPSLCWDKNYKYTNDIISTNTKPTQSYFLSAYPVRTQQLSTHHVNLRSVDPIIGLDTPSGFRLIDIEMVENPPIFNPNLQEQVQLDFGQEAKMQLQEWDKLIADKKSLMTIILNQCNVMKQQEPRLPSVHPMKTILRPKNSLNSLWEYIQSATSPIMETYSLVLE